MTDSTKFANPLTAAGREKMRENWRVGREVMNRYPGAGTSNLISFMLIIIVIVGFRQESDLRVHLLFSTLVIIAMMPLEIALSRLFAEAAHVRFGMARTATVLAAAMLASVGIGVSRKALAAYPDIALIATAGFFVVFTWAATLLCASYLREGRATPPPQGGAFEDMARGQLPLAMAGAIAAGFLLVAGLLAIWIAS